jgi:hypothetical protein
MVGRIQFTLPRTCDCGARGQITFEEDDIRERKEGGANTVAVAASGPFQLTESGQIKCLNCASRTVSQDRTAIHIRSVAPPWHADALRADGKAIITISSYTPGDDHSLDAQAG